ncbi:phosphatidylserine decarboxylase [Candidatus Protochlamydia phocaeensis]|uniref:phosphatidylserine decarboxylase n=1 Tax=Candidatus Protochlamydia phocaeensis TaxID=1414722 RepID=UPI000837D365|nr:phosphatidylserine decarboxylase [Candidatus Protochlamydia phocaeensis]
MIPFHSPLKIGLSSSFDSSHSIPSTELNGQGLEKIAQRILTQEAEADRSSSLDQAKGPADLLIKITALINKPLSSAVQFKDLYQLIVDYDFNGPERAYIYQLLESKFREIEFDPSSRAWVQRADLLDALDVFIKKYPEHPPLPIKPVPTGEMPWKEGTVPLVPYSKMKQATDKLRALGPRQLNTLSDVQRELSDVFAAEYTSTAKIMQKLTRRHLVGASLLKGFYRFLTRVLGIFYNQPYFFGKTLDQIARFSRKMGIQSIEVLSKKVSTIEGVKTEQFYYRGPRYLFGQSVYEYKTVNDWFKRDLTPEAREAYLGKVISKERKLEAMYGATEASRIVISNADARLRFKELSSDQFDELQELTGKALNQEAVGQAQLKRDDPTYYAEKYKFSIKNLLGREANDSMLPTRLTDQQRSELNGQLDRLQTADLKEEAAMKLKQSILKKSNTRTLFKQAQHELLAGMYRALKSEGAVQVIQRLAPADIHNYVAPVNGKPLSNLEAVKLLEKRLLDRQAYLTQANYLTPAEKIEMEQELEVFAQLKDVFTQQETLLGRPSQSTIDIYGTNASVSTPVIQNQSRILAQNDRKVMLLEHVDGSFSLHVFIGATGVNRVDVDPNTTLKKQGERQGDMQFGRDRYQADGIFQAADNKTTKDGLEKLRIGERQGRKLDGFPINGSTVISYYLPTDFSCMHAIERYKKAAVYGAGRERAEIELKANMGDPILVKKEIALLDALEKSFPVLFQGNLSAAEIVQQIPGLHISREKVPDKVLAKLDFYQESVEFLQKLWSGHPLTFEEANLKKRVYAVLEKRLTIIQSQVNLAEELGLPMKEVEELKQLEPDPI